MGIACSAVAVTGGAIYKGCERRVLSRECWLGRRVAEKTSLGTDHGAAGPAFIIGKSVRGGHYGAMPSLTDLDEGNLRFTTDYRRLYATLISGWMGNAQAAPVLRDDFSPLPIFDRAS